MRPALATLTMCLAGCSTLAPRIGVCPSPQSAAIGGWTPIHCAVESGDERDVWCVFAGRTGGKDCTALAETHDCGAWRVLDLDCGRTRELTL